MQTKCLRGRSRGALKEIVPGARISSTDGKIYWHVINFTPDMEKYKIVLSIQKAFSHWQRHFDPIFVSTSNLSEAHITFHFASSGDPVLPQAFGRTTLAYAFAPVDGTSAVYLNEKWDWSELHEPDSYNLFKVLVHELGHSFNLNHSDDREDIMYPTYVPNDEVNLTKDTISSIIRLYPMAIPELPEHPTQPSGNEKKIFVDDLLYNNARYKALTKKQLTIFLEYLTGDHISGTKSDLIEVLKSVTRS